ncbi:MAG: DNA polymerase III subunit gamma/tau [Nitrospirae bacterium]|nr:DNA polymerase III subunit gamma/tau [Nitrospirota bacterium]
MEGDIVINAPPFTIQASMSGRAYLVLARKWRPQTFEDLIGQSAIARILQNAIKDSRIAHAYIFSGPRGVGKTSTARIFAKALNCAGGPTVSPCGKCPNCKAIAEGSFLDVIEIDGASNNSVNDIREIRERVQYAPSGSHYKLYIIDEAHMLSRQAFNAFLKTLEEPPPHVIFILATTAPTDIIPTVLSRCQHLSFKRVPLESIKERLKLIAVSEGMGISDPAIELLARVSDGSIRDSLTLLDQIAAFSRDISIEDVKDLLGISDRGHLLDMAEAILRGDRKQIFETVNEMYENGVDFKSFARELIQLLRDVLVIRVLGPKATELSPAEVQRIESSILPLANEELLTVLLNELLKAESLIKSAFSPRLVLEMSLVRVSFASSIRPIGEIVSIIRAGTGISTGMSAGVNVARVQQAVPDGVSTSVPARVGTGVAPKTASKYIPKAANALKSTQPASYTAGQALESRRGAEDKPPAEQPDNQPVNKRSADIQSPDEQAPDEHTPIKSPGPRSIEQFHVSPADHNVARPAASGVQDAPAIIECEVEVIPGGGGFTEVNPAKADEVESPGQTVCSPGEGGSGSRLWIETADKLYAKKPSLGTFLKETTISLEGSTFAVTCPSEFCENTIKGNRKLIEGALEELGGQKYKIVINTSGAKPKVKKDLRDEAMKDPAVTDALSFFDGRLGDVVPSDKKVE